MKKTIFNLALGISLMTIISCGTQADAETDELTTNTTVSAENMEPQQLTPQPDVDASGEATNANPAIQAENPKPNATAKLNPPHGEPGHDCAIQVGAPLDGSGGMAAPQMNQPIQQMQAPQMAPATGNSGKINPPHGEPGHSCSVAVGAPLP